MEEESMWSDRVYKITEEKTYGDVSVLVQWKIEVSSTTGNPLAFVRSQANPIGGDGIDSSFRSVKISDLPEEVLNQFIHMAGEDAKTLWPLYNEGDL